ncbi:MAG: J domain-containing protein [Ilumatobacter sp.]|uniref:J domain-containing protein n=1 Tax=Ilumatobacter sp. TaxID=1967498 RepID=UPI00329A1A42
MFRPLLANSHRKGGTGTSIGLGYMVLGPVGLIAGPIANSLRKRYQRNAAAAAHTEGIASFAIMMLSATESLLPTLPRQQADVEALYAWHFVLTSGGDFANYHDALIHVAHCFGLLAHADIELAAFLLRYAQTFNWAPVLAASAALGFVIHETFDELAPLREAYEMFGLVFGADQEQIRFAYHRLARQWHPDSLGDVPQHVRQLAGERMAAINHAHSLLMGQFAR